MRGSWAIWPELLNDESCDSIIENAMKIPAQAATVSSGKVVNHEIRDSEIRWIMRDMPDAEKLFNFVDWRFAWANRDWFGVDSTYTPSLQFTTYREERKGHYGWHEDVMWDAHAVYQRKLSMVLQLSDPTTYTGGDLELDCHQRPPHDQLRLRGTMIVFPSLIHHRVVPITSGTRHSLVAWQEGPPWR